MQLRKSVAALAAAAVVMTACGGPAATSTSASSAPRGGTAATAAKSLKIAITQAPPGFNPVTATNSYSQVVIQLLFDPLVWQSVDQAFHPLLAASWDVSPDSRTFTFHLDPKATWTDGQPVTANDVAYTLDLNADPAIPATHGAFMSFLAGTDAQGHNVDPGHPLAGVKVVDSKTIQLITKQPTDPHVILGDFGTGLYVVPQHALQSVAAKDFAQAAFFNDPTVTDGAFAWVKYVTGQYVQLKANPNYYMGRPKVDRVLFEMIELNTAHSYFAGASARQAITMAIDRQELVQDLLKGEGTVAVGPVSPLYTLWADTDLKPLPYDPQQAKAMLAAAHFPFSQQLLMVLASGNQATIQAATLIQQNLAAIGINLKIEQLDTAAFVERFHTGQYDLSLVGVTLGSDPSTLAGVLTCKAVEDFNRFCDPKLDALFRQGVATPDYQQRRSIYDRVQTELQAQAPWVYLYWADDLLAYNTRIDAAAIPNAFGMQQPWLWDVKS
jgi:peptide/nickel transport system substrate-binding protein